MSTTIGFIKNLADEREKNEVAGWPGYKKNRVVWKNENISFNVNWKNRKIGQIINNLDAYDNLIIRDFSVLGKSIMEWLDILSVIVDKLINFYVSDCEIILTSPLLPGNISRAIKAMLEKEQELRSIRGRKGRPPGVSASRLDPFKDEIKAKLREGVTQRFLAKKYNVSPALFSYWLKTRGIR